jgi:hypothetical protein
MQCRKYLIDGAMNDPVHKSMAVPLIAKTSIHRALRKLEIRIASVD